MCFVLLLQKLKIYRKIALNNVPEFLDSLNKGKILKDFEGIGIFWSWEKNSAEAHWGTGNHTVLLEGLVGINDINYKSTALKNLTPQTGEEEAEIEVKAKSAITIIRVHSEKNNQEIWQGKIKLTANFKDRVLARYKVRGSDTPGCS